ncbi:hypothetical protein [Hymenobacter sp. GOD-10R]|uniref:hypothetical protein n=1 Tax=Hymenobacter sp. GOD-10R TaxID=3093922 RepID=UPI002D773765|nr:hypothetical protein [Hymenobacter sp. GOD-10R]WRQ28021.1 hypothetical protein SD425_23390 [Hymenobacter sp. GOD-10R]
MKRIVLFGCAAAFLTLSAAHAQTPTKVKTKSKSAATGAVIKSKSSGAEPVVFDGPIKRVETLSGIDVYPDPSSQTIMLSFTQQFTQPGTLVMTNYKNAPVYTTALDPKNNTGQPVDLGRIPAGTYLVEAKTGNYVYWKQVRVKYPSKPAASKKRR